MILLDTDVCIEVIRGNRKVLKKRNEYAGGVAISFMTAGELFYGAENSTHTSENVLLIENFLLATPVLHSDTDILRRFGEMKAALKKGNRMVPDADIFIAATAMEKAEALVTGNAKHFERFEGLRLENWTR